MTIDEYLSNPMGKGASFAGVTQQKQKLEEAYRKLEPRIQATIYLYRGNVIYNITVPSGTNDAISYDVIVEFKLSDLPDSTLTVNDLPFKVFSNCPSFIFTYAHVFRAKGMLCEWLVDKYEMAVRRKATNIRNPQGIIGFERSLYLALKFIRYSRGRNRIDVINLQGRQAHSYKEIALRVRTQSEIMDGLRKKEKSAPSKGVDNSEAQKKPATPVQRKKPANAMQYTSTMKKTAVTAKARTAKKTKRAKKI